MALPTTTELHPVEPGEDEQQATQSSSSAGLLANNLKQRKRWSRRPHHRHDNDDPHHNVNHKQDFRSFIMGGASLRLPPQHPIPQRASSMIAAVPTGSSSSRWCWCCSRPSKRHAHPTDHHHHHHHHCSNWQLSSSRIIFVAFLLLIASVLGFVGYHFLTQAEQDLAEAQFLTITERALAEAQRIAQRKHESIVTAAEIVGRMLPDAEQWPFVYVNGYEAIASKLLDTVAADEEPSILTFGPLVRLEQQQEWEEYANHYYKDIAKFPNGTGYSADFDGHGIWGLNVTFNETDGTPIIKRQHETTGVIPGVNQTWPFLFPAFQLEGGPAPVLLFSLRYGAVRAKALDSTIECSFRREQASTGITNNELLLNETSSSSCGSSTDMLKIVGLETRGPAAVLYEPIFPQQVGDTAANVNASVKFVGIMATALLLDQTLDNVFSKHVSGIDAVYTSSTGNAFTFSIKDGLAVAKGDGDLHDPRYEASKKSSTLTIKDRFTPESPVYTLTMYPNDELYRVYSTNVPKIVSAGAVLSILFTAGLFLVFDCLVRKEFRAKKDLLEAKRQFMRFVSHEVRTPLNSVCMGLTVMEGELDSLESSVLSFLGNSRSNDGGFGDHDQQPAADNNSGNDVITQVKEMKDIAQEIQTHAFVATDVLNDLLNYDRIENGTLCLELSFLPIWSLVERTAKEFAVPTMKKKIQLDLLFEVGMPAGGPASFEVKEGTRHEPADLEKGVLGNTNTTCYASSKEIPGMANELLLVGDAVRMTQVLRNLISNAIKFTPEGNRICIRTKWTDECYQPQILNGNDLLGTGELKGKDMAPTLFQVRGNIIISVQDTGAGLSPTQLGQLFQPGVQFNANTLQGGGGSGLGLFIARGIVEQHCGTLTATSKGLGLGSTFTACLPVVSPMVSPVVSPVVSAPADCDKDQSSSSPGIVGPQNNKPDGDEGPQRLRILVVDDAVSNRKLLSRLLGRQGHACDEAEDGQQALDRIFCPPTTSTVGAGAVNEDEEDPTDAVSDFAIPSCPYDCVLLDFEMDVMNGPTCAQEIRRRGLDDLLIIGITGNMLPEDTQYFKSCGADSVLPKPIKLNEIQRVWEEHGLLRRQKDCIT